MMLSQEITYRPHFVNNTAVVTIGFVKDAKSHINVQGFNVYHKNRLIKLFWRVCNAAGSDGRGVIGVLEANFIKPAQDKQWFEQTSALAKLKACLLQMQKNYWSTNCHKIGYASRSDKKVINASADKDGLHRIRPSSYLDDTESQQASGGSFARPFIQLQAKVAEASYRYSGFDLITVNKLKQENHILKERLQKKEEELIGEMTGVDRLKLREPMHSHNLVYIQTTRISPFIILGYYLVYPIPLEFWQGSSELQQLATSYNTEKSKLQVRF